MTQAGQTGNFDPGDNFAIHVATAPAPATTATTPHAAENAVLLSISGTGLGYRIGNLLEVRRLPHSGFVIFRSSRPGPRTPVKITDHISDSATCVLLGEVLLLAKMNWNSARLVEKLQSLLSAPRRGSVPVFAGWFRAVCEDFLYGLSKIVRRGSEVQCLNGTPAACCCCILLIFLCWSLSLCAFQVSPFFQFETDDWSNRKLACLHFNKTVIKLKRASTLNIYRNRRISSVVAYLGILIRSKILQIVLFHNSQIDMQSFAFQPRARKIYLEIRFYQINVSDITFKNSASLGNSLLGILFDGSTDSSIIECYEVINVNTYRDSRIQISFPDKFGICDDAAFKNVIQQLLRIN
jgi:hypothetical protein